MVLFLWFILSITFNGASPASYKNMKVSIELDSRNTFYVLLNGFYYRILNPNDFMLTQGMSISSFTTDEIAYTSKILAFEHLKEHRTMKSAMTNRSYSSDWNNPLFGRKSVRVAILRAVWYRDSDHPYICQPMEYMEDTLQHLDHAIRLWSGNQLGLNISGCYISECIDSITDEEYADTEHHNELVSKWYDRLLSWYKWPYGMKKEDFSTIAMAFGELHTVWSGVANGANPLRWFSGEATMFVFMNAGFDGSFFKGVFAHESTHNIGINHAGGVAVSITGQLLKYVIDANYDDYASYMAIGQWYQPITARQYYFAICDSNPQPWTWFKLEEEGVYTIRVYAFDHPYTKYFFGVLSPYHDENEEFDGVKMKYTSMALEIPFYKDSMVSKLDMEDYQYISTILEYRYTAEGQMAWNARSIRWILGPVIQADGTAHNPGWHSILDVDLDRMTSKENGYGDGQLPLGVTWTPRDIDKGTMQFRLTRIHPGTLERTTFEAVESEVQRKYYEPAYVDLEVTYKPNVPFVKPTIPPKFPTYKTSSSIISCETDESANKMNCKTNSNAFWLYGESEGDNNLPRVYNHNERFIDGRRVISIYNGYSFAFYYHCFGESINHRCINVTVEPADNGKIYFINSWYDSTISVGPNKESLEFNFTGNSIFIAIPYNQYAVTVGDMSGKTVDVTSLIHGGMVFYRVPDFKVDGLFEGVARLYDETGAVIAYKNFPMIRANNTDRIAFRMKRDNNKYEISAAAIPIDKFTAPTFLFSKNIKANEEMYYPIVHLQAFDYFYIDIDGRIPDGLKIEAKVVTGTITFDLSGLSGYEDISYKVWCRDVMDETKAECEFYSFTFNKDITLLSIREVLSTQYGYQRSNREGKTDGFDFKGQRYGVIINPSKVRYIPFKKTVNGKEYDFDVVDRYYELGNNIKPSAPTPPPKPLPLAPPKPDALSSEDIEFVIKGGDNEYSSIVFKLQDKDHRVAELFNYLEPGENKMQYNLKHDDYYLDYGNHKDTNKWTNSELIISVVGGPVLFKGSYHGSKVLDHTHLIIKNYMKTNKKLKYSDTEPTNEYWKEGEYIDDWKDGSLKLDSLKGVNKRYYHKSIDISESMEDIASFYMKMKICGKAILYMNKVQFKVIEKECKNDDYLEISVQSHIMHEGLNHLAIEFENTNNIEKDIFEISHFFMLNVDSDSISLPTTAPPTKSPSDNKLITENTEWEYTDDYNYGNLWTSFYETEMNYWRVSKENSFDKKSVICRYYRTTFTIESELSFIGTPKLELKFTEGIIVYINGFEIYRYNLEGGRIEWNVKSIKSFENPKIKSVFVPLSVIYKGKNYIAVEIHENKVTADKTDSFYLRLDMTDPVANTKLITPNADVYINHFMKDGQNVTKPEASDYEHIETMNKFNYGGSESEKLPWSTTISFNKDEARYANSFRLVACTNNPDTHPKSIIVYGSTDKDNPSWDEIYRNEDLDFYVFSYTDEVSSCLDELIVTIPTYKSYESFKVTIVKTRSYNGWIQFRLITFNQTRPNICKSVGEFPSAFEYSNVKVGCNDFGYKIRKCKENGYWDDNIDESMCNIPTPTTPTPPPTQSPSDFSIITENTEWEYSDDNQNDQVWNSFYNSEIDNWKKSKENGFDKKSVITRYYRTDFTIESVLMFVASPKLELKFSGGIIVYINGFEIYRFNLEAGKIDSSMTAIKSYDNIKSKTLMIPLSVIYQGVNYIGIEIHENQEITDKADLFSVRLGITDPVAKPQLITPNADVDINHFAAKEGLNYNNVQDVHDDYEHIETMNKFNYPGSESDVLPWSTTISFKNDEARYVNLFRLAGCTNDANTHPKSIIVYGSTDKDNSTWDELYRNEDLDFSFTSLNEIISCPDQLSVEFPTYKSYESLKVTIVKTKKYGGWIQFRLITFSQARPNICEPLDGFPSAFGNSVVKVRCSESGYITRKCKEDGNWEDNIDKSICKGEVIIPTTPIPTTRKPIPRPTTMKPTGVIPTVIEPTTIEPTTPKPTTPKPIDLIDIEIKVSNINENVTSELNENDKKIMKDSIIEIYKVKGITLNREEIEVIQNSNNRKMLLRRLDNDMIIDVIITIPESSSKEEIKIIAEALIGKDTLQDEIKSRISESETTIYKDADIDVISVDNPDNNEDEGGLSTVMLIVIIAGGVVVLLIIIIAIVCCILCRSRKAESHPSKSKSKSKSAQPNPVNVAAGVNRPKPPAVGYKR